jgi:OmpA-OmpF porin, OOP family
LVMTSEFCLRVVRDWREYSCSPQMRIASQKHLGYAPWWQSVGMFETLEKSRGMMNTIRILLAASLVLCSAPPDQAQERDVEGSKDHPLITRYPGSIIDRYSQDAHNEFEFPLGKLNQPGGKLAKSQHLEGKITHITYNNPKGRTVLEIYRNYESSLRAAGFEVLFTCASLEDCGQHVFEFSPGKREEWIDTGALRHLSARLSNPQGDVYVSLVVQQHVSWYAAQTFLDVVEMKPMETGLVTVNAASLAGDIQRTGHASVYGIYFDTGKADVKPESDATLSEISKLLQQDPSLKLYVVGHTDNVGMLASNMDLSKRRADAVVKVLTTKYNVASARLSAQGDGPTAPVASNDSEEGRAKNRRVELVKQ